MGKTRANLELAAQLAIAVSVVVVAGGLVKRHLFPAAEPGLPPTIEVGERLNAWQRNEKSLVFFFQIGCSNCAEAAPFYKKVVEQAAERNVGSIAIFPSSTEDSIKYLKEHDLSIP